MRRIRVLTSLKLHVQTAFICFFKTPCKHQNRVRRLGGTPY
ncbi:hypothetical protein [Kingella potus]|nr:hypothetical protein [Kingella potus]